MNNIAVILHVNNRPFYVFYYDVKRGKCVATSSTFLAIVTSSIIITWPSNDNIVNKTQYIVVNTKAYTEKQNMSNSNKEENLSMSEKSQTRTGYTKCKKNAYSWLKDVSFQVWKWDTFNVFCGYRCCRKWDRGLENSRVFPRNGEILFIVWVVSRSFDTFAAHSKTYHNKYSKLSVCGKFWPHKKVKHAKTSATKGEGGLKNSGRLAPHQSTYCCVKRHK